MFFNVVLNSNIFAMYSIPFNSIWKFPKHIFVCYFFNQNWMFKTYFNLLEKINDVNVLFSFFKTFEIKEIPFEVNSFPFIFEKKNKNENNFF